MKKVILIYAVGAALALSLAFAANTPTPSPTPIPLSGTITAKDTGKFTTLSTTSQSFSLVLASESGIILGVQGIESDRIAETQSAFGFQNYARPEKPDDAKVELWTKDGRRWKAQWVEVKP